MIIVKYNKWLESVVEKHLNRCNDNVTKSFSRFSSPSKTKKARKDLGKKIFVNNAFTLVCSMLDQKFDFLPDKEGHSVVRPLVKRWQNLPIESALPNIKRQKY